MSGKLTGAEYQKYKEQFDAIEKAILRVIQVTQCRTVASTPDAQAALSQFRTIAIDEQKKINVAVRVLQHLVCGTDADTPPGDVVVEPVPNAEEAGL